METIKAIAKEENFSTDIDFKKVVFLYKEKEEEYNRDQKEKSDQDKIEENKQIIESLKELRTEMQEEVKEPPKKPVGRVAERGKRANLGFDLDDMFDKEDNDQDKTEDVVAEPQEGDKQKYAKDDIAIEKDAKAKENSEESKETRKEIVLNKLKTIMKNSGAKPTHD